MDKARYFSARVCESKEQILFLLVLCKHEPHLSGSEALCSTS